MVYLVLVVAFTGLFTSHCSLYRTAYLTPQRVFIRLCVYRGPNRHAGSPSFLAVFRYGRAAGLPFSNNRLCCHYDLRRQTWRGKQKSDYVVLSFFNDQHRCIGQWLVLLGMGCVICNCITCLWSPIYFVKHTMVLALTTWFWFYRATDWTCAVVCSWTRRRRAGADRRASCSRSLRTSTRRRCCRAWSGPWW